jgi:dolichol-phosphate mannosyltransferase
MSSTKRSLSAKNRAGSVSRSPKGKAQSGSVFVGIDGLSVVVPTYNETLNIRPLCERLFASMKKGNPQLAVELLFVDDESEGSAKTVEIVKKLQKEGFPVGIECRKKSQGRGLSSAVLLGFTKAKYEAILCMDADLQHEPESVYSVALPVLSKQAEFTVGSRYCGGGGFGFDWAIHRKIISSTATLLAYGVSKSTDPMSGFFCTTKTVLARGAKSINPIGFKIGLEVMARCRANPVMDVPITFQSRVAGESKLTMKQNVLYLQQLGSLYWDQHRLAVLIVFLLMFIVLIQGVVCLQTALKRI